METTQTTQKPSFETVWAILQENAQQQKENERLRVEDIKEHIERMEKLRIWADNHNDKRKYLGAIAGMVFNQSQTDFARKNGFFVITPSGDTLKITKPLGEHKEW